MNGNQVKVRGTLKPDGTLELQEALTLPPGPVEVVIRALPTEDESDGKEGWLEYLQRAWEEAVARGRRFRSKDAIDADRARERELDEARERALERCRAFSANL